MKRRREVRYFRISAIFLVIFGYSLALNLLIYHRENRFNEAKSIYNNALQIAEKGKLRSIDDNRMYAVSSRVRFYTRFPHMKQKGYCDAKRASDLGRGEWMKNISELIRDESKEKFENMNFRLNQLSTILHVIRRGEPEYYYKLKCE